MEFTPYFDEDGKPGYVIENRGTGLQQIKQELEEALMPEAKLQDFVSAFCITFFKRRLSEAERQDSSWANFEVALLSELEKKGSMSVLEIMESSGLSRNAVSIRLRSLKERGLIEGIAKPKSPKQRYRLVRNS